MSIFGEMFAFSLFKNAVKSAYQEKKNLEELHYKMATPSPANLRDYCLICLAKGMSKTDQQVFNDYFNPINKYPGLEKAIERVELGRLKSLQQFILEKTTTPDELIIKLLAVLIDFNPRPFKKKDWETTHLENGSSGTQQTKNYANKYMKPKSLQEQANYLSRGTVQEEADPEKEITIYSATEKIRKILELDRLKKQQKENTVEDYCAQMMATDYVAIPTRKPTPSVMAGIGLLLSLIISSYWLLPKQYIYAMQDTYVKIDDKNSYKPANIWL